MTESNSSNSFAAFTAMGRILGMLAGFAMPVFLTHFLSGSDYGLYSQFYTLLGFLGTISAFGFQSNLYYFYPRTSDDLSKTYVGNTLIVVVFMALFVGALMLVPSISGIFVTDKGLSVYSKLLAICIFFYIPTNILYPLFVIRKDKLFSVLFPPAEILLKLILVITFAVLNRTLDAIFIALSVLQLSICFFAVLYTVLPIRKIKADWFNAGILKSQLKYIIPFGLALILSTLFKRFDKILCMRYITPEEYAIYSIAFFGIPGITQVYDSMAEVNLLNMAKAYKNNLVSDTLSLYQSFTSKMLSFSVPVILAVCVFSDVLIGFLFPPQYQASVFYFRVYIFSFIIGTMGAGTVLRATGNTRYTLRAYLLTLIVYLPVSVLSIRYFRTDGAITTAMLGIVLPKLFQIHFERNVLDVSFPKYMPWSRLGLIIFISVLAVLPVLAFKILVPETGIVLTLVVMVLYVLSVYMLEMKFGVFLFDKNFVRQRICGFFKKIGYSKSKIK